MTRRACLVASTAGYNLALAKMGNWLGREGWEVLYEREPFGVEADRFAFSVIFSWDVPKMIQQVNWVKGRAEVEIGGPAMTHLHTVVERATGIKPHIGPDFRFEEEPGDYPLIRTSRGCSVGCWFCPVTKMDGAMVRLYPDCSLPDAQGCAIVDDNFAETPDSHQETIVDRMAGRYRNVDLNSGIEPRSWRSGMFDRLARLPLVAWRTALDEVEEADAVERLLAEWRAHGIRRSKIWVYVLIGGKEPFEQAKWRADRVIEWGGEPRVQPFKPLTWLKPRSEPFISKGWTREQIVNLPRYYYGYYWRHMSFEEYLAMPRHKSGVNA